MVNSNNTWFLEKPFVRTKICLCGSRSFKLSAFITWIMSNNSFIIENSLYLWFLSFKNIHWWRRLFALKRILVKYDNFNPKCFDKTYLTNQFGKLNKFISLDATSKNVEWPIPKICLENYPIPTDKNVTLFSEKNLCINCSDKINFVNLLMIEIYIPEVWNFFSITFKGV